MMRNAVNGLLAGAAGTAVLDVATYADMTARDRPPSELPQKMVVAFSQQLHAPAPDGNRKQGLGALMGYADGFCTGALFGMARPMLREVPWWAAAAGLAAFTMLISEGTATAMKQTDPRSWGAAGWIADIVPRLLYGAVTCLVFDRLCQR